MKICQWHHSSRTANVRQPETLDATLGGLHPAFAAGSREGATKFLDGLQVAALGPPRKGKVVFIQDCSMGIPRD